MATTPDSPLDRLWKEYSQVFDDFDDLTLARWMAQTLGQIQGRTWRLSHPLIGAYRLAAQMAHDRQIWLKRLVNIPVHYREAPCCRAPLVPLLTRDVLDSGLVCQHCTGTAIALDELDPGLESNLRAWAETYAPVHAVAHWDDRQRESSTDYEKALDQAADQAEQLLCSAYRELLPRILEHFPVVIWEDQDECLQVRPEDIQI